jgi:hypothetical protein
MSTLNLPEPARTQAYAANQATLEAADQGSRNMAVLTKSDIAGFIHGAAGNSGQSNSRLPAPKIVPVNSAP